MNALHVFEPPADRAVAISRKLDPSDILAMFGAVIVIVSVLAGLWVLYVPDESRWRLTYHDSLAAFADVGRVARCAWLVSGDVQTSSAAAMETLKREDATAQKAGCQWYEDFRDVEDHSIEWTRLGPASLQLCGEIRPGVGEPQSMPLARDYTFSEIGDTPIQTGSHCYTLDVTTAPVYNEWGHPIDPS